jgi:hypothetical protein
MRALCGFHKTMVRCGNCGVEVDALMALENAPYSCPNSHAIWHPCLECGAGNHIRFQKDTIQRIEITGAPGPTWEVVESEGYAGIESAAEPEQLVIWACGRQFVIPARS